MSTCDTLLVDLAISGFLILGKIYSSLLYGEELKEMDWVDFPVAHECDLFSLYDRIVEMLNLRIFKIGSHQIMDFLDLVGMPY